MPAATERAEGSSVALEAVAGRESKLTRAARAAALVRDLILIGMFAVLAWAVFRGDASVPSDVRDVVPAVTQPVEEPLPCESPRIDPAWGAYCPHTPEGG
jgi:hypothetical protein